MKSYKGKKVVLFYSSVQDKKLFSIQGFYKTDISILEDLGYTVVTSNRIRDFLHFRKYDIAFLYFYRYGLFPAILAKLFGKQVIFTGGIDNLAREYASRKNYFIQKHFFQFCNLFSDVSLIVSTADQENIKQIYAGRLPKNNLLCFHSIDTEKLKYTPNIPKKNVFLTIAWMTKAENVYRKGILRSIHVFKELRTYMPEYTFHIIGPLGEGSDIAIQLIEELGLEDKVFFTGTISEAEKINYLKTSKYYFQLSEYEGFGIAATEALIAGNIVIHSGKGGLKDAVGNHGICIENIEDYPAIARQIYKHSSTLNGEQHLEEGIQYVEKNFSYSNRKNTISKILRQL
ncbi:MAG: glycosyltransferase family 4 protein [Odoribacter sp.]|nr:glycosyltransferase family 4 protein [Odoribacter sp.]